MASAESEKTPLLLPDSSKPKRNRTVSEIIRQQRNERPSSVSGASTDDGEIGPSVRRERTFSASETEYECDDIPGWEGSCFCHPQALLHRIIALILMCLLGFGSYFCYDGPGALQSEIKSNLNITTAQFSSLYAWYCWPNAVLPIVGGFLMDRVLGIRFGTMVFAMFIVIGQLLFALGGFVDRLWVMEIGRFVFGIGGESLAVAQNTYAVAWFKGKELNMVFGFQLSVARVGSTVNFVLMEPLFDYIDQFTDGATTVGWTLLIAGATCVMSFFCAVILAWMDKRRNRMLGISEMGASETGETVKISDIKDFPISFWFLTLACLAYYGAIFPFVSLAQDFFKERFNFSSQESNKIIGLIYLISAPVSPMLGLLLDKVGKNITWVFLAVLISGGCHCLLAFTQVSPYIGMIVMGVAYSLLASALWPIAALLIPEYQLGTAYGLMQAIQNLGTALITMAAGSIVDEYGYDWLEVFFIGLLGVSLASTMCMWICDCTGNGYINMSISEREKFDEDRRRAEETQRRRRLTSYTLMRPRTSASLRNRYLSRVGAGLPSHLGHGALVTKSLKNH